MKKRLIGTHNSISAEEPTNFISKICSLIAKCQDKTLEEQFVSGVRLFDLHVKPYREKNEYTDSKHTCAVIEDCILGYGLCDYKTTLLEAVKRLHIASSLRNTKCYIIITVDGDLGDDCEEQFEKEAKELMKRFNDVVLLEFNVEKPEWKQLYRNPRSKVTYIQEYPVINGLKALFPFPRFWNMFIKYKQDKSDNVYSLRDFV